MAGILFGGVLAYAYGLVCLKLHLPLWPVEVMFLLGIAAGSGVAVLRGNPVVKAAGTSIDTLLGAMISLGWFFGIGLGLAVKLFVLGVISIVIASLLGKRYGQSR